MVFAYDGLEPPRALRRRIARGEAAGIILFARNVRSAGQVRAVVRSLQEIGRPRGLRAPLLVMADQEGGPVRRIAGAPERAAADVATASEARADGRAAARTLRSAGITMNLAPVADVGAFAQGIRALVDDPAARSRLGANGRARYEAEFRWDRIGDDLLAWLAGPRS